MSHLLAMIFAISHFLLTVRPVEKTMPVYFRDPGGNFVEVSRDFGA